MQQQQSVSSPNKPIHVIITLISKHTQHLNKVNENIIKKLGHFQYPMRSILQFYNKLLLPRLKKRADHSYIFSDIFIWYTERFVGFFYAIQQYINKLDIKARNEIVQFPQSDLSFRQSMTLPTLISNTSQISNIQNQTSLSNIGIEQKNEEQLINQNTLQQAFRIPQAFMTKIIVHKIKKAIIFCEQNKDIKQKQSLQMFLSVYQKCLQDINKPNQLRLTEQRLKQTIMKAFYKDVNRTVVAVKYGLRFLFIARLKLRVKKANKRIEQRKMRIKQLIDGQKKYTEGLKDYIEYIKKPIQATDLVSKEDIIKIFSTIQPILALHTHFYQQLHDKFANYDKNQIYGDIFAKNFPYFKIYNDYIYYADQAQALILKLADQHQQIEDICKKFMSQKQKKASDQLKQPTFRIARYQMILKQILKNTNPIHKDYNRLLEAQKVQKQTLEKINQNVDKICRRNRLNQLQTEFGTEQKPIYVDKRQFLQQFQMLSINQNKQEPVNVVVFNDIVLVVHNQTKKIIKWIIIDQNFYVRKQEDNKTYKNVIKIHSEGFITFSAGPQQKHFNKAESFYNLLQRVSKQNQQSTKMVYIQVIGTQQIGSTSFAKHTEYVIQIKYLGLRKLVHLRFSQMQPLVTKVQNHYDNDLNISQEEALKKNWFNNHKSKTIEDRKRTIQQILQKMLNHELVKKEPDFLLSQLKIDPNFFKKNQQYKKKRLYSSKSFSEQQAKLNEKQQYKQKTAQKMIQQSNKSLLNNSLLKPRKKQYKQAETILCATQIKIGRDVFHDPDDIFVDSKKFQYQKIAIKIYTMVEEQPRIVEITQAYTVEDVCHKVSKLIGLRMNRDFRLFHQIGKKQLRVLDQQQKLMKIFNFHKNQAKIGFVSQIFGSLKKIITPQTHPKLVFKKYYYLPIQIQQSQCRKDLTRLRLIVFQIFAEIKQMKYQLSFDEYLLFLAMIIYIQTDGQPPQKIQQSYVGRLIPETIFKLKNYTEQQWIQKCRPHLTRLSQQIDKIVAYNAEQLKLKKIKADSISKTALYFGHRHLCSQIALNKIKSNVIFGSNLFYVQPYKKTYQDLSSQGRKMAYNMWLAIKVQGLNLLTPSSKQTVLQLKYQDIQKIFVYSQSITFKIQGIQTCQYRFNTYQSFEISQLVKYNKCLNQTLLQLQRNQDLILKARMYKQQSLIYRSTYDRTQKDIIVDNNKN